MTIIIIKSTDISLDRQASSDRRIFRLTDKLHMITDADKACRSSEISVDLIIIIVIL